MDSLPEGPLSHPAPQEKGLKIVDETPSWEHAVSTIDRQRDDDAHRPKPGPLAAEPLRVVIDAPARVRGWKAYGGTQPSAVMG